MTKSQIFAEAHKLAREFRRLYPSYQAAFAEVLETIYADIRKGIVQPETGFQIKEPSYKRRQFNPRTGQWVTL